ncbi:MAG: Type 1 glutamine amidotransferase-like domain-containing protein [Acidimicrobiales bacterium]
MLQQTGRDDPSLCLVPTADETDLHFVDAAEKAFEGSKVAVSHLRLFPMPNVTDPEDLLMSSDAIFVGGGSTANMLAVWRVHGLDRVLRRAWESGVVLGGSSAGAMCWFEGGLTDSFGPQLSPLADGLSLLAGSYCPHYNRELRRPRFQEAVTHGSLPPGIACADGVTAHFVDDDLGEVLAEAKADDVQAWRVGLDAQGQVSEAPLDCRPVGPQ